MAPLSEPVLFSPVLHLPVEMRGLPEGVKTASGACLERCGRDNHVVTTLQLPRVFTVTDAVAAVKEAVPEVAKALDNGGSMTVVMTSFYQAGVALDGAIGAVWKYLRELWVVPKEEGGFDVMTDYRVQTVFKLEDGSVRALSTFMPDQPLPWFVKLCFNVQPLPMPKKPFAVRVRTLTCKEFVLTVKSETTVEQLQELVMKAELVPPDQQRLLHKGKQLDNGTLGDYGITEESTLTLVLRLRGGMYHATSGRDDFDPLAVRTFDLHIIHPDRSSITRKTLTLKNGQSCERLHTLIGTYLRRALRVEAKTAGKAQAEGSLEQAMAVVEQEVQAVAELEQAAKRRKLAECKEKLKELMWLVEAEEDGDEKEAASGSI